MKFMEEVENMQSQAGKRKILLILKKFHFHQKNRSQYLVTSFSQRITGWPGVIFSGAPTVFGVFSYVSVKRVVVFVLLTS